MIMIQDNLLRNQSKMIFVEVSMKIKYRNARNFQNAETKFIKMN